MSYKNRIFIKESHTLNQIEKNITALMHNAKDVEETTTDPTIKIKMKNLTACLEKNRPIEK